jgi:hypothetical protein
LKPSAILQRWSEEQRAFVVATLFKKKVNVYLPSLMMKVPDHVYVFGSLLLQ